MKKENVTPEKSQHNRAKLVAEQLSKNQQRMATIVAEIEQLEVDKKSAIEEFDAKIARKRDIIATISKYFSVLFPH